MVGAGGKEIFDGSLVAGGSVFVGREKAQREKKRRQADQYKSAGGRQDKFSRSGLVYGAGFAPDFPLAFSRVSRFCVLLSFMFRMPLRTS